MAWSVYLIRTVTGDIGPKIEPSACSFAVPLNSLETLSFTLRKSAIPAVDRKHWLAPWWAGVLLMWDNHPIMAGPIISRPTENFELISFDCAGIRSVFSRRYVTKEFQNWSELPTSELHYSGMSLGTIAKRVVQAAQNKAGGQLPISYAIPDQFPTSDIDHERTYEGFNIANLDVDGVLTKLSEVINGPDILFKPRLLNESQLTWDLWTGTEREPRIAQTSTPVWDTTTEASSVTDLTIVSTGTYMANRVYSTGAGTDQGTLITVSEDLSKTQDGVPLLETAIAVSQSADPKVVKAHGDGYLQANRDMLREISMTVRADGVYPLGSFWPGDLVEVLVNGWVTLEDGVHKCRLLAMQGDISNFNISMNMQTEE